MRSTPSTATTTTLFAATMSTDVEAEVFAALAHLTMDVTGAVAMKPLSQCLLRFCVVIGRMLVLAADYMSPIRRFIFIPKY